MDRPSEIWSGVLYRMDQMGDIWNKITFIKHNLTEECILEQTAEECSELSKALLKKSRKLRGENYTPLSMEDIQDNLCEEFNDLLLCAMVLGLEIDENRLKYKLDRWVSRNTK